jgi:uncharacterized membrane protein
MSHASVIGLAILGALMISLGLALIFTDAFQKRLSGADGREESKRTGKRACLVGGAIVVAALAGLWGETPGAVLFACAALFVVVSLYWTRRRH